jgi:hypothetical protein
MALSRLLQTITHKTKSSTSACLVTQWVCSLSNFILSRNLDLAHTYFWVLCYSHFVESSLMLRPTVSRPSLFWNKAPMWGLRPDFYYYQTVAGLLIWGSVSDERTDLSFIIAAGPRQRSHSRVTLGLVTIFYCLKFETSLLVASYVSQGYGGGIRPRLHTGNSSCFILPSAHRVQNTSSQGSVSRIRCNCLFMYALSRKRAWAIASQNL